jgi:uncharacterized protein (TIGR02246 family)
VATACLLSLPGGSAAQAEPPPAPERATVLSAAREVMGKARYCALVTLDPVGHPRARAMDPFAPEADLTVWLATKAVTRKVEQIRADPRVTLFYFDPSGPGYVTLLARAELVTDPTEKAKRWKEDWATFYADENRGEDYVLIRCTPIRLELVSYGHGLLGDPETWRPIAVEFPPHRNSSMEVPMDAAQLKELGRAYTAAWCSQDAASVAAFFAEDGSLTINDGTPAVGREAITEAAQGFMTAFPDLVVTMDGVDLEGSRAVYRWTLTGTNTGPGGTGNTVRIGGHEEWTIGVDGLIAESQGHFDAAEYERQLSGGR